jgi:uncharacterized RDD family membrane protein YckC
MVTSNVPSNFNAQPDFGSEDNMGPDPETQSEYYDGINIKRIIAYVIDVLICGAIVAIGSIVAGIVGLLSFGLLFGPLMAILGLVPFIYHTLLIGGDKGATFGMRFAGIKVYRLNGQRPEMLQAFIQTALFYLTVPTTSFLILVVCLFNVRRRCLHDILAGTLVLNDLEKR